MKPRSFPIALILLLAACEPKRDPDFPQYVQPRPETLAWRRLTDQPSPELSVVPRRQTSSSGTEPSNLASSESSASPLPPAPTTQSRCRNILPSPTCTKPLPAFGCGITKAGDSRPSDPPVEMHFFAASLTEAEFMAIRAEHEGATTLTRPVLEATRDAHLTFHASPVDLP